MLPSSATLLKIFGAICMLVTIFYILYPVLQNPEDLEIIETNANHSELSAWFSEANEDVTMEPGNFTTDFFMNYSMRVTTESSMNQSVPVLNSKNKDTTDLKAVEFVKNLKGNIRATFSYRDLEAHLCSKFNDWANKTRYSVAKGPCPRKGIVTVVAGGRTGNQMWEYAAAWGVAKHTGLDPYVPNCIKDKLSKMFDTLTVPDFRNIAHCPVEFEMYVSEVDDWIGEEQGIILDRYTSEPDYVLNRVKDIRKEFSFNKELKKNAQNTLWEFVKKLSLKEYTFIGVHVRRTDYLEYLRDRFKISNFNPKFFINAMNYYKNKYSNCLFIVASDDPAWCHDQFGQLEDVFLTSYESKKTPAEDLAILAACNHSIYDFGTYGEWGAFLTGGQAIYYDTFKNYRGRYMKGWVRMK